MKHITSDLLNKITSGDKIAVERGCDSKDGCFCTGKCREIIGWYIDGKFVRNNTTNHSDEIKYLKDTSKKQPK